MLIGVILLAILDRFHPTMGTTTPTLATRTPLLNWKTCRGWPRQGGACTLGGPLATPFAYIFFVTRNPRKKNPFSRSHLCSAAATLPRSGAPADLFPAPCRREGRPPRVSSPPWMLPGCVVSSFLWTMGP